MSTDDKAGQEDIERIALAILRSSIVRQILASSRVRALFLAVFASWIAPVCQWIGLEPAEVVDVLIYGAAPATTAGAILAILVTYRKKQRDALAKENPEP